MFSHQLVSPYMRLSQFLGKTDHGIHPNGEDMEFLVRELNLHEPLEDYVPEDFRRESERLLNNRSIVVSHLNAKNVYCLIRDHFNQ